MKWVGQKTRSALRPSTNKLSSLLRRLLEAVAFILDDLWGSRMRSQCVLYSVILWYKAVTWSNRNLRSKKRCVTVSNNAAVFVEFVHKIRTHSFLKNLKIRRANSTDKSFKERSVFDMMLCYSRKVIIITAPRIGGHRGYSSISSSHGLYHSLGCSKPRTNVRMRPIGLLFTSYYNNVLASSLTTASAASPPILWLRPVKYWPRYTSDYPMRLFFLRLLW